MLLNNHNVLPTNFMITLVLPLTGFAFALLDLNNLMSHMESLRSDG